MTTSKLSAVVGAVLTIALVVLALWSWGAAGELVRRTQQPHMALWAVRCGSIAAWSAAQVIGLTLVAGLFYSRDRGGEWLRLGAGTIFTLAFLGAATMGWISK
jgi:hypothetical protein